MRKLAECRYPNVEAERARRGLTVEQAAHELGITDYKYYSFQTGQRPMTVDVLKRMCALYGVSMEYLLEEAEKHAD